MAHGLARCVPLGVFRTFQALATTHKIDFPMDQMFLQPAGARFNIPLADVRLLSSIVQLPEIGIAGALRIFRGQTSRNQRPNKALLPDLYQLHLASYPDLQRLRSLAKHGVVPQWKPHLSRVGVRPLPTNYPTTVEGTSVVTHRVLQDYYRGRCIIANIEALSVEPEFHSCAFALVPKKDVPPTEDGRTIHAPRGNSINEATDTEWTPDARWDSYSSISARILALRRRYPGCAIYAPGADITEAFHHVPVHSRHTPAFGGTIPRSRVGIVSGMAVFGWTASPGFFAVMGKAARHYQRTGASHVLGYPEPFWIVQRVDDIVIIEVNIGDRLVRAERRLGLFY